MVNNGGTAEEMKRNFLESHGSRIGGGNSVGGGRIAVFVRLVVVFNF